MKVVLKGTKKEKEHAYFVAPKKKWQQQPLGMNQELLAPFNSWSQMFNYQQFSQQYQYPVVPWKKSNPSPSQLPYPPPWVPWRVHNTQLSPCPQGWIWPPFQGGKLPMTMPQQ